MKSFFTTAAVAALSLSDPCRAYDEAARDQVFKDFPNMPPLGVFKMKELTPKVRRTRGSPKQRYFLPEIMK
jgi:hypothetical protein